MVVVDIDQVTSVCVVELDLIGREIVGLEVRLAVVIAHDGPFAKSPFVFAFHPCTRGKTWELARILQVFFNVTRDGVSGP